MTLQENIRRIKSILTLIGDEMSSDRMKIQKSEKNSGEFIFLLNDEEIGWMRGSLEDDTLWINRITIYPKWRGEGFGEKFIIKYLKEFGGSIGSKSELRNRFATRMWERIINRSDIQSEVGEIYSEYMNDNISMYKIWI
jgi:GNAT superfamily N-acetyltransferase